jgi:hypothetical protein
VSALARYRVVFTPVGWQVVDSQESRDPVREFGSGADEYGRARSLAGTLNAHAHGQECRGPNICIVEWREEVEELDRAAWRRRGGVSPSGKEKP